MSNSKTNIPTGARFMVSPDGRHADWVHPLEVSTRRPDWSDATDLNDVDFNAFMAERRSKYPPVAA